MSGLTLVIGNKNYSSWSMRAWLLVRQCRIEFEEVQIPLRQPDSLERKLAYSPAGKVPILIDGDMRIWDSLAIVEHVAEKFPEKRECRTRYGAAGEFLFGEFTAADTMFAFDQA